MATAPYFEWLKIQSKKASNCIKLTQLKNVCTKQAWLYDLDATCDLECFLKPTRVVFTFVRL